jgi:hypothetical protein
LKSGPKSYDHLKLKRQVPKERRSIGGGEVKRKEGEKVVYVSGGEKKGKKKKK